ncbi:MAG: Uncharacterised protein [Cryomorphaceae bacterium]|nr:MAG: Uncharacterised protein [Cryomorphaceae bacterium]
MEQLVLALIRTNGVLQEGFRNTHERFYIIHCEHFTLTGKTVVVNGPAVRTRCFTQTVQHFLALCIRDGALKQTLVRFQCGFNRMEERRQFRTHLHFAMLSVQDAFKEGKEPAQIVQGHHRNPISYERVVRIVPLRALGIHPDTAFRDEVGHLRKNGREDLL